MLRICSGIKQHCLPTACVRSTVLYVVYKILIGKNQFAWGGASEPRSTMSAFMLVILLMVVSLSTASPSVGLMFKKEAEAGEGGGGNAATGLDFHRLDKSTSTAHNNLPQ